MFWWRLDLSKKYFDVELLNMSQIMFLPFCIFNILFLSTQSLPISKYRCLTRNILNVLRLQSLCPANEQF